MNPSSGLTDAVTLPLLISTLNKASCVNAERGMFLRYVPSENMNEDESIKILPLNDEPLSKDSTINPKLGETEAVTLPLAILFNSSDKAENGISVKPAPLPLNTDADTEPEKFDTAANTSNPLSGEIDAVAEPLNIFERSKSDNADSGISNNLAPLPEYEPEYNSILLPLTKIEPVN